MLAMGMGAPSYGGGDLTHYGYTVGYSQAATEQGSPDPGPFLQRRGALSSGDFGSRKSRWPG